MILWINGAFGVGKTETAKELHRKIPNSYIFDPENAGGYIHANIPEILKRGDFQDFPMWRSINFEMIRYLAEHFDGTLVIPMTITNRMYYDELVGKLTEMFDVQVFLLCAERETILSRLISRGELENGWAAQQIERCLTAFENDIPGEKIRTDRIGIEEVAEMILSMIEQENTTL